MGVRFDCPECGKRLVVKGQATGRRVTCPGCAHGIVIPAATDTPPPELASATLQPVAEAKAAPPKFRRYRPLWALLAGVGLFLICLLAAQPIGVERSPFQFGVVAGPVIGVFGALGFVGTTARLREMSRSRLCYLGGLVVVLLGFAGLTANAYAHDYRPHPLNAVLALVVCLGGLFSLLSAAVGGVLAIPRSETGEVQVGVAQALGGMAVSVVMGVGSILLLQAVAIKLFVAGLIFAPILFIVSAVFLIRALGKK
jgi:DNA-directed RNA polymerase subunit RPC12/RpoP